MINKTIDIPVYSISDFKEIAYQTAYILIKGWKRVSLSYNDFSTERPDIVKNSNLNVDSIFEESSNLWIKDNYKFEFHLSEDRWNNRPPKISIYHTLEEAYDACLESES